eukprot:m.140891 g.140891  ORF g.140891 m.140891 type:complete len:51 (-) comp34408_c0_seq1:206-358(-)
MVPSVAKMYLDDKPRFDAVARRMTTQYATIEPILFHGSSYTLFSQSTVNK